MIPRMNGMMNIQYIRNGMSIVTTCRQLTSTKLHAQCDELDRRRCQLTILATIAIQLIVLSTSLYSTIRERQRVARVHLRQLILVHCYCSLPVGRGCVGCAPPPK